jgi:hypothetical protein
VSRCQKIVAVREKGLDQTQQLGSSVFINSQPMNPTNAQPSSPAAAQPASFCPSSTFNRLPARRSQRDLTNIRLLSAPTEVTFESAEWVKDGCSERLYFHTDAGSLLMSADFPGYFVFEPGRRIVVAPGVFRGSHQLEEYHVGVQWRKRRGL